MSRAGQKILKSARAARAAAQGGADEEIVARDFVNVKALRMSLGLAQPEFAERYRLSVSTLRDWEQGRTVPDRPAQVLLRIIEAEPEMVQRVLEGG